jgi:radical SAM superfamily enzyme YgiQ (UPF0313 family)
MAKVLLISYDNESHIPFFPQHLFYLAGALKKAGHTVGFWFQDIHHGKEEALTQILDEIDFDMVGLGFCAGYWQYEKAKKISEAVNSSRRRKDFTYILGGHGPAGAPEFFLSKFMADRIVIGDGEKAICKIDLQEHTGPIIRGEPFEEDQAPIEIYQDMPMDIYRLIRWPTSQRSDFCMPVLSSRGCKWHCSFCYRMREGFWERSIDAIMDEIRFLHRKFQINHFQFSDELLMSSEKRTEEICTAILRLPFKIKWDCNGRLNFATLTLLRLMRISGAQYINYGIESLDQKILNQMKKGLTVEKIQEGVMNTLEAGLSPGLNLLWGFPGDTIENLEREKDFLVKYDPCDELRTIRPVTPYPGCSLYNKAIEMGLVKDAEDFYENKHKNSDLFTVNFMDMPTKEAHYHLKEANWKLVTNYYMKKATKISKQMVDLYVNEKPSFRGFREV